jgi:Lar family restriction alleviation protein
MSAHPAATDLASLPALKPCPFCGGSAQLNRLGGKRSTHAWVECTKCRVVLHFRTTFEAAVAAWNTRAEGAQ